MNVAYVTPEIVRWARERAGLSVERLAQSLRLDPVTLEAWEGGQQLPPFGKAEALADRLHIPFGYLFLSKPPTETSVLPDLRTVGGNLISAPSANFLDVLSDTILKQQWYSDYLKEMGASKAAFVSSSKIAAGFEQVAGAMSKALGVDERARSRYQSWEGFLGYLVHRAEDIGIIVMQRGIVGNNSRRTLDVDEFRGFAIADQFAPLIFINARDAKAAKNFTIVHELCHIWIGESGISNPDPRTRPTAETNAIERFCNRVAAEVLAPRDELERYWRTGVTLDDNVAVLARHFHVSRYVVVRQACEVNRISHDQYLSYLDRHPHFLRSASPNGDERSGNFYNTFMARNGKRLISGVLTALAQDRITYRGAANLLGIKFATLKKVAERFA